MFSSHYLQVVFALLIMTGILWGVLKMSKVAVSKKFSREIKVIDRLAVETNTSLLIVQVRKKEYLMSVSNKNIEILETFS